jgi:hypothetical protein
MVTKNDVLGFIWDLHYSKDKKCMFHRDEELIGCVKVKCGSWWELQFCRV